MVHADSRRLGELLAPHVAAAGLDLEAVTLRRIGARLLVQVLVDRDGGVDLDTVAEVSRRLAAVLDELDALEGAYTLEVGSPGVDRPLTAPRHWRRAVGRRVRLSGPGRRRVARVLSADEAAVVVSDGTSTERIPYGEITRAVVEVEFQEGSP